MNTETKAPRMSFWQIWNMSFGFLGIQYGFGLQQANMSPIYRVLGAEEQSIPLLWLAGPITGLFIQPLVGAMSDRTWHPRWGRRRPFFLAGAIFTSAALVAMPYSSSIWMAAGLMWMLDAALNVTMEPFRAFVADKLPVEQRAQGFAMQSFFVGFGQTLANLMPFALMALGVVVASQDTGRIPDFVIYSFLIGALAILAAVGWTVFSTSETPPSGEIQKSKGVSSDFKEVIQAIREMPEGMRQLWWVKFFTWYGLPLMWQYLSLSISRHVFHAPQPGMPGFEDGVKYGNLGLAIFNVACFGVSFFLPALARRISRRGAHAVCLFIGGLGFLSMEFTQDLYTTMFLMFFVGISWASIMSMPYVMLSNAVPPARMGVYMGIFNMFIVIPQLINMITVPLYYKSLLGNDPRNALALAGVCLLLAGGASLLVKRKFVEA